MNRIRSAAYLLALSALVTAPAIAGSDTISQSVEGAMHASNIPGAQVVIVDHGKIVLNQGYGVRSLASGAPVDPQTRFEIGSITKQFTAAAILQLKEQGKLALSDRLGKYVPEYPAGKDVTVQQLLWQVSGIPNYTDTPNFLTYASTHTGSFAAMLDLIKNEPLNFQPGTKWQYSNTNYILLGRVVEIASGVPWETYVRTHIFAHAGMTESTFDEDEASVPDMATGYYMKDKALAPAPPLGNWAFAAGAIVSTASDLAKWDAALFGGKIVADADLKQMTSAGHLNGGTATTYGFGWVVDTFDGQDRIWHNGGTFGFGASNDTYPNLDQRIIVLENDSDAGPAAIVAKALTGLDPQLASYEAKAVPGEDAAVTARAQALWNLFQNGPLDRSQFTASMNAALTPEIVAGAKAQFSTLGMPTKWVYRGKRAGDVGTIYAYRVTFSSGAALTVYMSVVKDGKISGYLASPN